MKTTQQIIVLKRLEKYGQINNLWAINNGIWRLGAVINRLRNDGLKIEGGYLPKADGTQSKIYNYTLKK